MAFAQTCEGLSTERVAKVFATDPETIKRFEISSLNVVKFKLPRSDVQVSVEDRDMHGASRAALPSEVELN
jgi:hypothetical protein